MSDAQEPTVYDVAVIGAGFSGLGMAIRLKQQAKRSFVVLEKAGAVGGTWRDNTYPGCACDIPSHLYSFSFERNPGWTRMYPTQQEIWAYLEGCADRYGLREHIRLNAAVAGAAWDEASATWTLDVSDGRPVRARAIASGMGGLHVPGFPDIPGQDRFEGPAFHSAQWRHDVDLTGKRVAVIGTGASAIQFVPQIQPKVAQLDLYQRTPPWILPKGDRPMSALERGLFEAMPALQDLYRGVIFGLCELRGAGFLKSDMALGEKMARGHLEAQISDPALRAKLTPDYTMGCKRVLISNDFYPAVAQPNVALVTERVAEITPTGVTTADGAHRPADVLIYGTGFKPFDAAAAGRFVGRDGRSLGALWAQGPEAYLGLTVAGFPNLFFLMGPNTGLGHNSMVFMIESQIHFILEALDWMDETGARALDVKPDAQASFRAEMDRRLSTSVWAAGCKSWYLSADGKNRTIWPGLAADYRTRTKTIARGDFVTT